GEIRLLVDLADLVDNKAIRWGFGAEGTVDYRVDEVRAEDFELAEARTGRRPGASDWWQIVKPLLEEAPECCVITRDRNDDMVGLCVFVTPNAAPAGARRHQRRTAQRRVLGARAAEAGAGRAALGRGAVGDARQREGAGTASRPAARARGQPAGARVEPGRAGRVGARAVPRGRRRRL